GIAEVVMDQSACEKADHTAETPEQNTDVERASALFCQRKRLQQIAAVKPQEPKPYKQSGKPAFGRKLQRCRMKMPRVQTPVVKQMPFFRKAVLRIHPDAEREISGAFCPQIEAFDPDGFAPFNGIVVRIKK